MQGALFGFTVALFLHTCSIVFTVIVSCIFRLSVGKIWLSCFSTVIWIWWRYVPGTCNFFYCTVSKYWRMHDHSNHLCQAIEEGSLEMLDNTDFQDTDIPMEIPLPEKPYLSVRFTCKNTISCKLELYAFSFFRIRSMKR